MLLKRVSLILCNYLYVTLKNCILWKSPHCCIVNFKYNFRNYGRATTEFLSIFRDNTHNPFIMYMLLALQMFYPKTLSFLRFTVDIPPADYFANISCRVISFITDIITFWRNILQEMIQTKHTSFLWIYTFSELESE